MNEEFNNKEDINEVNSVENVTSTDINVVEQSNENIDDSNATNNKEKNNKTKKVLIVIIGIIISLLIALTIYVVLDKKDNNTNDGKDNNIVENNKDNEVNNNEEEDDILFVNDNYVINEKKYILYSKNDKMGLMDDNKNIIIDAKYDGVYYHLNGDSNRTVFYWKNDDEGNPLFIAGKDNSYVLINNNVETILYKEKENLENPYIISKIGEYLVLYTANGVRVIDEDLNVIIKENIYSDIFQYDWNYNIVVAYDGNKTYEFDINLNLKNIYNDKGKIYRKSMNGPTDGLNFSNYIIGVEKDLMSEMELYHLNRLNYQIITTGKETINIYKDGKNIVNYEYNAYALGYRNSIIILEHIGENKKTLYDVNNSKEIYTCDNCQVELKDSDVKVIMSDNSELIYVNEEK